MNGRYRTKGRWRDIEMQGGRRGSAAATGTRGAAPCRQEPPCPAGTQAGTHRLFLPTAILADAAAAGGGAGRQQSRAAAQQGAAEAAAEGRRQARAGEPVGAPYASAVRLHAAAIPASLFAASGHRGCLATPLPPPPGIEELAGGGAAPALGPPSGCPASPCCLACTGVPCQAMGAMQPAAMQPCSVPWYWGSAHLGPTQQLPLKEDEAGAWGGFGARDMPRPPRPRWAPLVSAAWRPRSKYLSRDSPLHCCIASQTPRGPLSLTPPNRAALFPPSLPAACRHPSGLSAKWVSGWAPSCF